MAHNDKVDAMLAQYRKLKEELLAKLNAVQGAIQALEVLKQEKDADEVQRD